ncbi:MAG: formylglycine-generating enzyme family protein, partial [Minicystis sp.]
LKSYLDRATPEDLDGPGSLFAIQRPPPLSPWRRLWPSLRAALQTTLPGREPDVNALVRAFGRGEVVARIPCLPRPRWAERASVWIDCSDRLAPLWSDQLDVWSRLGDACGHAAIAVRFLDGRRQARSVARRGDLLAGFEIDPATPVLVLGDLGAYGGEADREAWTKTGRRLRASGVSIAALVPAPPGRWPAGAERDWSAEPWERTRPGAAVLGRQDEAFWKERAERLLTSISRASLVQPGLLRRIRRLLSPGRVDVSTEVDVWNHRDVRGVGESGLVLWPSALERWREKLTGDPEIGVELKARIWAMIRESHAPLPAELLGAERVLWLGLGAEGALSAEEEAEARSLIERSRATLLAEGGDDPAFVAKLKQRWRKILSGVPDTMFEAVPDLAMVRHAAFAGVDGLDEPATVDGRALEAELGPPPGEPGWWAVRQEGDQLVFSPSVNGAWPSGDTGPGSPVSWLRAARPVIWVRRGESGRLRRYALTGDLTLPLEGEESFGLLTDRSEVTLRCWEREPWAEAAGRDEYGLWAEARVKGVPVRFRWIPPGRFMMGSPEGEEGRFGDEGPRHQVTWTKGHWLGETPVTQALWEAVMGENPSGFKSPERPVEQVSWEGCARFCEALNDGMEGLLARFPSEAEWEYACRAGTETATWVGDDVARRDSIAWYDANSEGTTHRVASKLSNSLGLFDMLGNVWEWCSDKSESMKGYESGDVTDPSPSILGSKRVYRGGSWISLAWGVRAAVRIASAPEIRIVHLGFRLARGQESGLGAEPQPRSGSATRDAGRDPGRAPSRDASAPPDGTVGRRSPRKRP